VRNVVTRGKKPGDDISGVARGGQYKKREERRS
jgi:hypothetical protein